MIQMPISFPVNVRTLKVKSGDKKRVYYPHIFGTRSKVLEDMVNQAIVEETQKLIDMQVGGMPSTVEEMLGTYEIKNNQRRVLSLSLSNYTYHERAAHGMTYIQSLTFDLEKGRLYKLEDLFKRDSHYIERLSDIIREQIKERNIETLEPFTQIKADQDFYIADKTIVIYFQLYELTPYVFGFPMFPISVYSLLEIIDESGPLGRMAENN